MTHCTSPLYSLRGMLFAGTALLAGATSAFAAGAPPDPGLRPNIVLMLADDMGYNNLGCYGTDRILTPNIDRLAVEGVRFTDAHSPSAVCQPTRYGILSGRDYFRCEWHRFQGGTYFRDGEILLPKLLQSAGYRTAMFGKWHLGIGLENHKEGEKTDWNAPLTHGPLEAGFDYWFGMPNSHNMPPQVFIEGRCVWKLDRSDPLEFLSVEELDERGLPPAVHGRCTGGKAAHEACELDRLDLIVAERASAWLAQQSKDQPFFLYLPFFAPHVPLLSSKEFEKSSPLAMESVAYTNAGKLGDMIRQLDHAVGQVLDALKRHGFDDNTLVIFTSDNGNVQFGDTSRVNYSSNGPFLGQKTDAWEGGHRVPFLARWPGRIPAGVTCGNLLSLIDLYDTCLSAADVAKLEGAGCDGLDQLAVLQAPATAAPVRNAMVYGSGRGVRVGDWVYLAKPGSMGQFGTEYMATLGFTNSDFHGDGALRPDAPPAQLYNLAEDLSQTTNLHEQYPAVAAELAATLQATLAGRRTFTPVQHYLSDPSLALIGKTMDHLALGDERSERGHNVVCSGQVVTETIPVEIGTLSRTYRARTVRGKGARLEFTLEAIPRGAQRPGMIEIQEIHNRRADVFGYTVLVNDKEIYFRSYEEMGAGPNHYFVQFDWALAPEGTLRVSLRNEGEAPFSIGRVWAYSDFFGLAAREGTYRKMTFSDEPGVLLGDSGYEAAAQPGVSGEDYTNRLWQTLKTRFEGAPYLPGSRATVQYAFRPLPVSLAAVDAELTRSVALGVPSQIAFVGSEWGFHPTGMDGLGGRFGDVKYSQILFDPVVKAYRPTWPDTPGGTTWPTWNDPQLQKFLAFRLTQTATYYADRRAFMQARGDRIPAALICQEWGLSCKEFGDCNDAAVQEALADGVTLTPENGLEPGEQEWIGRNLSRVPARFARIFAEAAGRDCVVVDRGEIRLPEERLQDQYYFHTWYEPVYPFYDDRRALWQTGVGLEAWTTGETGPHVPFPYYDYVIALGKLATVNLERGFFRKDNLDFVGSLYELGFQWVTPCNSLAGDADLFLPGAAALDAKPCAAAVHCERKLLDVRFQRDNAFGPPAQFVSAEHVTLTDDPRRPFKLRRARYLWLEAPSRTGRLVYRFAGQGEPFDEELGLMLTGTLAEGDESYIEVSLGRNGDALEPVDRLFAADFIVADHWPWKRTATVKLGQRLRGERAGYIQLLLHAKDKQALGNVKLESVRLTMPWDSVSGHRGGEPFTVRQRRIQRLWVQDRAVFERTQEIYRTRAGEEDELQRRAALLATQGLYRSAYRLLAGGLAGILPARFAVRGHGRLGNYPLSLEMPHDEGIVLVDLEQAGPKEFNFALKAERPQPCTLRIDGLCEAKRYALASAGENRYRVTIAETGGEPAVGGQVAFELMVDGDKGHKLPALLSGVFLGGAPGGILIETQEPDLWLENPIFVPVASDAVRMRVQDGMEGPITQNIAPMDKVELVIGESGEVRELKAIYGRVDGRIERFHPPVFKGTTHNGIVELDDGQCYELDNRMPLSTFFEVPGLKPHYRNNRGEELSKALRPGLEIELRYCPYTYNDRLARIITIKAAAPRNNPKP